MRAAAIKLLAGLWRDESGVTLVEYGIGVALAIFIGAAIFVPTLATDIGQALAAAGQAMPN